VHEAEVLIQDTIAVEKHRWAQGRLIRLIDHDRPASGRGYRQPTGT
jgi:hypothetical protein